MRGKIFARLIPAPKARLGWGAAARSPLGEKQGVPRRWMGLAREARRQFRSKKVRAFSNKGHQTGLSDFLEAKAIVCSPRLRARLARNWAAKSYGGTKSQETIFSEMRRFVITKLCIKIIFYSNFLRKISHFAGLRRFFIPSPNIIISPRQNI